MQLRLTFRSFALIMITRDLKITTIFRAPFPRNDRFHHGKGAPFKFQLGHLIHPAATLAVHEYIPQRYSLDVRAYWCPNGFTVCESCWQHLCAEDLPLWVTQPIKHGRSACHKRVTVHYPAGKLQDHCHDGPNSNSDSYGGKHVAKLA